MNKIQRWGVFLIPCLLGFWFFYQLLHKGAKMAYGKVTPKTFNEAAWNLNLPLRWEDKDKDGVINPNEISVERGAPLSGSAFIRDNESSLVKIIAEGATRKHLAIQRTPEYIAELDKRVEETKVQGGEAYRRALRDRDFASRTWAHHTVDFSSLSNGEQQTAWILLHEVVPHIDALYQLQRDPNNLQYAETIGSRGDFLDFAHARYSGGPWCQSVKEAECGSMAEGAPERVPYQGMWPANVNKEDVAALENGEDPEDLLSDFVYVVSNGRGLDWRSLNANPLYRPHLDKIRDGLRKAAAVVGIDPTLAKFLNQRAGEFDNTRNPYPFADGDIDWTLVKGGLDVTLGFYETYNSPFEHTAIITSYIGPVNEAENALGKKFQGLVPEMDAQIGDLLGKKYAPRNFEQLPPLKFADLVSSGDGQVSYVPIAYYLPNVAPHGRKDVSKKMFASNNILARFRDVMKPMGDLVVHPSQQNPSEKGFKVFVVGHENAHGVGPRGGLNALGEYASAIEEAKADIMGIASLPLAVSKGIITQEEADQACIGLLYSFLRGFAYGLSDAHGTGAIVEFTTLYKAGAIVEKEGSYAVNFKDGAIYKGARALADRFVTLQWRAKNEGGAAKTEFEEWLSESRNDMPTRMKAFVAKLEKMPLDVYPWYTFKFSPKVELAMNTGSKM